MKRGILDACLDDQVEIGAPMSGVQLGIGQRGPVRLRLFRLGGTRVVVAARLVPAQLLVVRVAAAGTPVQVVTERPAFWRPLLGGDGGHLVTATETRAGAGGPTLVVDDRAAHPRGSVELLPWQCRLDLRPQWTPAQLGGFAHGDITVFGALPAEFVPGVARAFEIPVRSAESLARLDATSFAVLRRGRIEYVSLNPTSAEAQLLPAVP
ncbi:hypothetical protein [uncultured Jatrophihabitans sp.]|uniref:hypothetical protein n=1 Tax=uncultured Jatrophihabitans sp. TaxID=1610747 RepID=UPI0035CB2D61